MTPEEQIGRNGQKCLERWAVQAGITANAAFHDEKGWDAFLQLPPVVATRTPDRVPPEVSAMVQIKTTRSDDRRASIKLSNWKRMCTEPVPWLVLAIHLDANDEPARAYLVGIGETWMERGLRRLRELGADALDELHKHAMDVSWGEDDRFSELHGRELLRLIRRHVHPDQIGYVTRKMRLYEELGYEDRRRRVTLSFRGPDEATLCEHLSDLAVGLRDSYPEEWRATVSDRRFGVDGLLKEFGREAGEMRYEAPSLGKATLEARTSDAVLGSVSCDCYRAQALFPFLPDAFDKTRFVAPHLSCVIRAVVDGERKGISALFSFQLPTDAPINLGEIRGPIRIVHAMAHHQQTPVTLRISRPGGAFDLPPESLNGFEGISDRDKLDMLADAVAICSAFDVPDATELVLEDLGRQREHVRFLAHVLRAGTGPLTGPYREAVGLGEKFGATTECGLHLPDRSLGCFVGIYGAVTACQESPGLGCQITVAEGRVILEKVVAIAGDGDELFDAARAKVLETLRTVGCVAVSNHLDPTTRRQDGGA
jgi:hypothetical protein